MRKIFILTIVLLSLVSQAFAVSVKEYSLEKLSKDSPLIVRVKCSEIHFISEAGITKRVYTFAIQEIIKGNHGENSIKVKTLKNAEKLQLVPQMSVGDEAVIFFTNTLKIKGLKQGYVKLTKDTKTKKMYASYRDKTYTYETLEVEIKKFIQ